MIKTLVLIACFLTRVDAFVVPTTTEKASSTVLFYQNDKTDVGMVQTAPLPAEKRKPVVIKRQKKPTIYPISSLDELYEFLQEDDDRLTAIKIHAPWCKSCQHVGLKFTRLASRHGDIVRNGKAERGEIRCADITFSVGVTSYFIHEQLQVKALPTLQLYKGTKKLWQASGVKSIKHLTTKVETLLSMSSAEFEDYVDEVEDDGILEEAIEDSFFDNAYVE